MKVLNLATITSIEFGITSYRFSEVSDTKWFALGCQQFEFYDALFSTMSLNSNRLNTQYCHRNIRARSQAHFFFRRPGLGIGAGYVLPCAVQSHNNVVWRQSHFMTILSLLMICTCSSQSQTLRLQTRNRSSKFQTQIFFYAKQVIEIKIDRLFPTQRCSNFFSRHPHRRYSKVSTQFLCADLDRLIQSRPLVHPLGHWLH